jgi:hypothetical protein
MILSKESLLNDVFSNNFFLRTVVKGNLTTFLLKLLLNLHPIFLMFPVLKIITKDVLQYFRNIIDPFNNEN